MKIKELSLQTTNNKQKHAHFDDYSPLIDVLMKD